MKILIYFQFIDLDETINIKLNYFIYFGIKQYFIPKVMDFDNWDFSSFNNYKKQRSQTQCYKAITKKNLYNKYYNELSAMLVLAEKEEYIKIKGGIKYSVAKFINRYHKLFKWKKQNNYKTFVTCCVHWPNHCGGYNTCHGNKWELDGECYCSTISNSKHKIIWNQFFYK